MEAAHLFPRDQSTSTPNWIRKEEDVMFIPYQRTANALKPQPQNNIGSRPYLEMAS